MTDWKEALSRVQQMVDAESEWADIPWADWLTIRAHIEGLSPLNYEERCRLRDAEARVRELEADAARYRWLRDYEANWQTADLCVIKDLEGPDWSGEHLDLQDLDAAVDTAMQASREGK